jgi:hypothetical protein
MANIDYSTVETPKPQRKWFKRLAKWIGVMWALLIVLMLIGHGGWLWYLTHQLDNQIAEIEARGEPMTLAALRTTVPPPEVNGWGELAQAIKIVQQETPAWESVDDRWFDPAIPLTDAERSVLETYVTERAAALPLIEAGFAKPQCVMDVPLVSPLMMANVPELGGVRSVANLLRYQALVDFDRGDHALALRRLEMIELPARAGSSYPTLVGMLVGHGCRAVATMAYIELAPVLKVAPAAGGVTPAQLKSLIASLLDDTQINAEQVVGLQGERIGALEATRILEQGQNSGNQAGGAPASKPQGGSISRYIVKPFLRSNALVVVRIFTAYLDATQAATLPGMYDRITRLHPEVAEVKESRINFLAGMLNAGMDRGVGAKYRIFTDRRLAATALAIAWYRAEHDGEFPTSLEALVPTYLPSIPIDAMSPGQPLRYRAGETPILWSIGTNGIDDNGDDTIIKNRREEWNRPDRVVHLLPQLREVREVEE